MECPLVSIEFFLEGPKKTVEHKICFGQVPSNCTKKSSEQVFIRFLYKVCPSLPEDKLFWRMRGIGISLTEWPGHSPKISGGMCLVSQSQGPMERLRYLRSWVRS